MSRKKHQVASDSLGFPTLSLPDLNSFSDDERLLAQVTVGIVRGGGAMYGGRFIESASSPGCWTPTFTQSTL
jgi:hypothetical protein